MAALVLWGERFNTVEPSHTISACAQALIEAMPGGFAAMNSFVRETICLALEASNIHYEKTFKTLVAELTASIAKDEDERAPLPTLLTSVREQGGKDHKN